MNDILTSKYETDTTISGMLFRSERDQRKMSKLFVNVLSELFPVIICIYLIRRKESEKFYEWLDNDNGWYVFSALINVSWLIYFIAETITIIGV